MNERARGGVHENNCKYQDIERVVVAVSKGIISSVFALVTNQRVLYVGKIRMKNLYEQISYLEEH